MARRQIHELMRTHELTASAEPERRYGLAFWPLGNSCNSGGKVSVHELAEGVEPGQNRRHHLVYL